MPTNINKLTDNQKDVISGLVAHRFFNRITERNVYDWLRNFKHDEVDMAIEILKNIDYYREDDIIDILDNALKPFVDQQNLHLHFVPIGKPGKSGQMIVYIIQGVLKQLYLQRHRFHYYACINELSISQLSQDDVVFYVDDVIGTGKTFVKYEHKNADVSLTLDEGCPAEVRLLCLVTTERGKEKLESIYPKVKVIAEGKKKAFDVDKSCFGSYYKMLPIREFAYKYGNKIEGKTNALGYENSQLLTVFSHAVPNNTLPIIWKHKGSFVPLVPRSYSKRGTNAFMDRNETNRWIFFFLQFFKVNNNHDASQIFHDRINYCIMSVLRLLLQGKDEVIIAGCLGLHRPDMDAIWERGILTNLWDDQHHVTPECLQRYQELLKQMKFENTAYRKEKPNTDGEQLLVYLPETFRGLK